MASGRAIQVVKSHVPLIKFPPRHAGAAAETVAMTTQILQPSSSTSSSSSKSSGPPIKTSSSKPVGSTARGSGLDFALLPQRYHRQPMSIEEMEYIERGGPE